MYLRNRVLMGNVCFLVFMAFMLLQAPAFFGGGAAVAGGPDAWVEEDDDEWYHDGDTDHLYLPDIYLNLPEGEWVSTIDLYMYSTHDMTGDPTLLGRVYEWAVSTVVGEVYNGVLHNVYHAVAAVELPDVVGQVYEVYIADMIANTVYLSVYLRPPEPAPPPPPPSPPPTVIDGDVETVVISTGLATINWATSTATARPFYEDFLALALDPNVTVRLVGDLPGIETDNQLYETLLTLLDKANDKTTEYVGNVNASFPPGAIDFSALYQQYPNASFVFESRKLSGDDDEGLGEALEDESHLRAVSPLYQLAAYIQQGGTVLEWITQFQEKVTFGIPFAETTDPDRVAIYQLVDGQLIFVFEQTVDPQTNQILMPRMGTSRYVVLENTLEFTDLPEGHWAYRDVRQMVTRQVIRGMTETTFEPATTVTRAQFATMLQRALGLETYEPEVATFSDVQPGDWFFGPVEAAVEAGLAVGMGDGTFAPNEPVSREQMATFMVRALEVAGEEIGISPEEVDELLARFVDRDEIAEWALENTALAVKTGIIRGLPDDLYAPQAFGDRAQAAVMMKRMLVNIGLLPN